MNYQSVLLRPLDAAYQPVTQTCQYKGVLHGIQPHDTSCGDSVDVPKAKRERLTSLTNLQAVCLAVSADESELDGPKIINAVKSRTRSALHDVDDEAILAAVGVLEKRRLIAQAGSRLTWQITSSGEICTSVNLGTLAQ